MLKMHISFRSLPNSLPEVMQSLSKHSKYKQINTQIHHLNRKRRHCAETSLVYNGFEHIRSANNNHKKSIKIIFRFMPIVWMFKTSLNGQCRCLFLSLPLRLPVLFSARNHINFYKMQ